MAPSSSNGRGYASRARRRRSTRTCSSHSPDVTPRCSCAGHFLAGGVDLEQRVGRALRSMVGSIGGWAQGGPDDADWMHYEQLAHHPTVYPTLPDSGEE